jgi:transcriptional regulator with XRE-family HTH domain
MISTDIIYKIIGSRLKEQREKAKATQEDIAIYLELSRASVANYESGKQRISVAELYRLSEYFDVEMNALLPSLKEMKTKFAPENILDEAKNLKEEEREELKEFIKKTHSTLKEGGEK